LARRDTAKLAGTLSTQFFRREDAGFSRSLRQCQNDLRNQIHREFVYRRLQVQNRSQLFIRSHDETLSVAAMCVSNPDCASFVLERKLAILQYFESKLPPCGKKEIC